MAGASSKGVLSHLSFLETQTKRKAQQQSGVAQLKARVEELREQRDRLRAEVEVHQKLQQLRTSMDQNKDMDVGDDSENSKLLRLMAKHTQLTDILQAHHVLGGYDVMKTSQGKSLCFSLPTAFQGTMLETYHIEMEVKKSVRISRHSIPPFIPVERLAKDTNMHNDIRGFLDTLSRHLNAFAARKQQLKLVKERHQSVEVLESNGLCSLLVLMLTMSKEKTALLCSLEYSDPAHSLPTRVSLQCEEMDLSDSPQWQKNTALLQETPLHEALSIMKETRQII